MSIFDYNAESVENLKIEDTSILDSLVDSKAARRAHLEKDRSHRDKRMSLKEAVAEFISDGDVLTDTGFSYVRTPIQAYWEMMRQGKKGLQVMGAPNSNHTYMIANGNCSYSHCSYAGVEMRGTDRALSRYVKEGRTKVLSEWSHGSMALGYKAAQLGVAGLFSKSLLGSDIARYNPYVKTMQNPMRNESDPVMFVPALHPDIAIIHVHAADKYGNGRFFGPAVNDIAIAAAAKKLIITAEEIVPEADMRYNNKGVAVPFMYADAVVELPYGGIPGSMPGCYYWTRQWWEKMCREAMKSEDVLQNYIHEWILDTKDQFDVLEKLGGPKWIVEARRQTKAAEYDNEDDGFDFDYDEWKPESPSQKYY